MKTKLIKTFTREFPLIQIQMWGRRYSLEFLGEKLPHAPIHVFFLKDGLVTGYKNTPNQMNIINSIIRNKLDNDSDFIKKYVNSKSDLLKKLFEVDENSNLSLEDFKKYLLDLFEYWHIHYIAQFLPLDESRFTEQERYYALDLRNKIEKAIHHSWNSLVPILKKLFPNLGELVTYIGWDELFELKIPNVSTLQTRQKEGVFIYNGEIVSEEELRDWEEKDNFEIEWDNKTYDNQEVAGQIACTGKITGFVRIILKKEDVVHFQDNEILVSYMTMPAFVYAIQKAAAFITDEGGITCHAAIVARELKIPCIIGTKIATKVLKDGDLVEVNADTGVVTILKRAK